eukprot:COSAG02_NODE_3909_length_6056_cov_3.448884_5_plen_64_part_01
MQRVSGGGEGFGRESGFSAWQSCEKDSPPPPPLSTGGGQGGGAAAVGAPFWKLGGGPPRPLALG